MPRPTPCSGPVQTASDLQESDWASYASFGRRLVAFVLDLVIASAVLAVVSVNMAILQAVGLWPSSSVRPWESGGAVGSISGAAIVVAFVLSTGPVYVILFEASPWQATFGKRLLHIYVTTRDRQRMSLRRSFGRSLWKWLFTASYVSLISVGTILLGTEERKALHDFAAKTLVLRGRPVSGGTLEPWRIATAFGLPFVWILGTFLATV